MKKQYVIYSDESFIKGTYYSNFYGGALLEYNKLEEINEALEKKKKMLNLYSEIKWTKVTYQYLDKYIELMDLFFDYIEKGDIKIRIMFRQNAHVPKLSKDKIDNQYFLLYYQFIKHAFGLDYCNDDQNCYVDLILLLDQLPDTKEKCRKFKNYIYKLNINLKCKNISIKKENIAEIDSKKHVILQCTDVILGAMNYKLNDFDKVKLKGKNIRDKTTIAKTKLYKHIYQRINKIYPNFNIGTSTSHRKNIKNRWLDPYRHWNFISKNSSFDKKLTKK